MDVSGNDTRSGDEKMATPQPRKRRWSRVLLTIGIVVASVFALGGVALGVYAWNNTTYAERNASAVSEAGYIEHRVMLTSGTELAYAEGPDNGPAVLLVHAQGAAWESYDPVLPALAKEFHVFAIDVAGHGSSARTPGRYDVESIGSDVIDFLDSVVGEPVILSGHSSGGLIAAWVAAAHPEGVSAVLLEDPPLFSTDAERMPAQFNYVDLAQPAHEFLAQSEQTDFASWYIEHNAWIGYFGGGRDGIVRYAQGLRRDAPEAPLTLWFLPPVTNESFRFMHEFDPEFADAFFLLEWQAGFDQEATLAAIDQPTILVHANWRVTEAGILGGAMTDDDAARAVGLLDDGRLERVSTGHGFHFEDPDRFVALVRELAETR